MQPTFLPWLGYFDLIDQSNVFIFLDTAQFEKQSWQQRNRIPVLGELAWLTVPVLINGRSQQKILEAEIHRSSYFPRKRISMIEETYRRAPYFGQYFPALRALLEDPCPSLSALNQRLIAWLAEMLGLRPTFRVASELKATGKRTETIRNLCLEVGATTYLSPLGSSGYLLPERDTLLQAGLEIVFQNYEHPTYRQRAEKFCAHASIIDLLFNEGELSLDVVRKGRRNWFSLSQVLTMTSAEKQEITSAEKQEKTYES
jgi:hypothetical protein